MGTRLARRRRLRRDGEGLARRRGARRRWRGVVADLPVGAPAGAVFRLPWPPRAQHGERRAGVGPVPGVQGQRGAAPVRRAAGTMRVQHAALPAPPLAIEASNAVVPAVAESETIRLGG